MEELSCREMEEILSSKIMSSKVEKRIAKTAELSSEYLWKLIGFLPPIMDVPPPKAQKAFSNLLSKAHIKTMKNKLPNIFLKSEDNSLKES